MERRLRIDRSGSFLASPLFENTVFLTHSGAMGLHIRQKLSSLGPILAIDALSPAGCQRWSLHRGLPMARKSEVQYP